MPMSVNEACSANTLLQHIEERGIVNCYVPIFGGSVEPLPCPKQHDNMLFLCGVSDCKPVLEKHDTEKSQLEKNDTFTQVLMCVTITATKLLSFSIA